MAVFGLYVGSADMSCYRRRGVEMPDLPGTHAAARTMQVIVNARNADVRDVVLLDPTADKVNACLEEIGHQTRAGDFVVLSFAGHGSKIATNYESRRFPAAPGGATDVETTFLLYDRMLIADEIDHALSHFKGEPCVTIVLDACEGAALYAEMLPEPGETKPILEPVMIALQKLDASTYDRLARPHTLPTLPLIVLSADNNTNATQDYDAKGTLFSHAMADVFGSERPDRRLRYHDLVVPLKAAMVAAPGAEVKPTPVCFPAYGASDADLDSIAFAGPFQKTSASSQ